MFFERRRTAKRRDARTIHWTESRGRDIFLMYPPKYRLKYSLFEAKTMFRL